MKNRVTKFSPELRIYDFASIENRLNENAEKGLYLEKARGNFWTYKRDEHRDVRYAVSYFCGSSEFDSKKSDRLHDYIDMASEYGYEHVTNVDNLQVFVTNKDNYIPLETDDMQKFNNIISGVGKSYLRQMFISMLLISILIYASVMNMINYPFVFLSDNIGIISLFAFVISFAIFINRTIDFFIWKKRNKVSLEYTNKLLIKYDSKLLKIELILSVLLFFGLFLMILDISLMFNFYVGILIFVGFILLFFVLFKIFGLVKKSKINGNKAKLVYYFSAIGFTILYFTVFVSIMNNVIFTNDNAIEGYRLKTRSVFMTTTEYYDIDDINYTVITPRFDFVYEIFYDKISSGDFVRDYSSNFDAITFESIRYKEIVVFYEKSIIDVNYKNNIYPNDVRKIEGKIKNGDKNTKIL